MSAPPPARHRRWLLVPAGALLGGAAAFVTPGSTGCVYHDTCIMVTSPGTDWCRNVAFAKMWPVGGSFDDAEPVLRPDGGVPRGCRCYNDAENQIFLDEAPLCKLDPFVEELEQAAREEYQSLVPPGYDHNCWTMSGPEASTVEGAFQGAMGDCIGSCEYGSPPLNGSCPTPSPYECETGDGGDIACDSEDDSGTSTGEAGLDETGNSTSGGVTLDIDAFVYCDGQACEVDESLARQIYNDPSPLIAEGARMIYDSKRRRHVLYGVEPGSLVHALGLRNGDMLESIDDMVIHDLDSALQAYARLGDATTLAVRVKRGTRWQDLTYTFVP